MSFIASLQRNWHSLAGYFCTLFHIEEENLVDAPFSRSDIALFQQTMSSPTGSAIDVQTWNDLLLDQYSDQLSPEVSIFGQQILHQRLREGMPDDQTVQVRHLLQDAALSDALHLTCQPLRCADTEISALLFGQTLARAPAWDKHLWLVPLAFFASLGLATLSNFAWIGIGVALSLLVIFQMHFEFQMDLWNRSIHSLQQLLHVFSVLGARADKQAETLLDPFLAARARAGQINRSLTSSMLPPAIRAYGNWFFLQNVRHYFRGLRGVSLHLEFLRQCYLNVANLEADLALVRHLRRLPTFCWAERNANTDIMFDQVVHPLLAHAAPLSLNLQHKGAFISGQNGIGKSTLLRTIGLNLLVARAFGFCYAHAASVPMCRVYSSMQSEDSLVGGESLYIAELRRARELLAASAGPQKCVYIIDEVFRGTNHLESISAAAAVLHTLAKNGMVIVSSHNLVLAPLLEDCLTALCVTASAGDCARLTLVPGVLTDPNGITLLSAHGFSDSIKLKANRVFSWLNGYLAHPTDCVKVLDAG